MAFDIPINSSSYPQDQIDREAAGTSNETLFDRVVFSRRKTGAAARLKHCVANLSPAFFSLNMGTGIVSILLYTFPYPARWLRAIGIIVFIFNIFLFLLLGVGNVIRYIRFNGLFCATLKHPAAALPWGTFPMGFVTIVNMTALVCVDKWGERWGTAVVALWCVDATFAVLINIGIHTIESLSASWLLPIVSSVVAGASGGVVARAVSPFNPTVARSILIASYIILGTGLPLALFITTIYLYRLIVHGIPAPRALPSLFLLVGPCGQGSFGFVTLGSVTRALAYDSGVGVLMPDKGRGTLQIAEAVYAGGSVTGLILWGLALYWYLLATVLMVDHIWNNDRSYLRHQSFNISFTALTFPIGVWASATNAIAVELNSEAFRIIGAVVSIQVMINWLYVMVLAVYKMIDGSIFEGPEMKKFRDFQESKARAEGEA
ncbi:hypothetical protein I302_104457 [Kwoniella bestiolae CBS 10118]|uniref:Sulfite efflux pump SSU1 n=1 Tax=Kwoniella bestiolae CBS 10118 TaxID=1296100 RepID=A0AAJ8K836_9TREE